MKGGIKLATNSPECPVGTGSVEPGSVLGPTRDPSLSTFWVAAGVSTVQHQISKHLSTLLVLHTRTKRQTMAITKVRDNKCNGSFKKDLGAWQAARGQEISMVRMFSSRRPMNSIVINDGSNWKSPGGKYLVNGS